MVLKVSPMRHQIPVTALSFLPLKRGATLLLAGQGPEILVYNYDDGQFLGWRSVLCDQAIHGIQCHTVPSPASQTAQEPTAVCLIWGGRSISILSFIPEAESRTIQSQSFTPLANHVVEDWILDACIVANLGHADREPACFEACLVTAHNHVLCLQFSLASCKAFESSPLRPLSVGPSSILYSAHIIHFDAKTYLVAAGTVFGHVILWAFDQYSPHRHGTEARPGKLLCKYSGHEGSVFGVRLHTGSAKSLFLASCSDDRTIRFWNTDGILGLLSTDGLSPQPSSSSCTGFGTNPRSVSPIVSRCLDVAMGHVSRIWSIRFVDDIGGLQLVSFGEDATVHVWNIVTNPSDSVDSTTHTEKAVRLELQGIMSVHHGKNIWAGEILQSENRDSHVVTGSADGGISSGCVDRNSAGRVWSGRFPVGLPDSVSRNQAAPLGTVFNSMAGEWKMDRTITSQSSTFPSGHFTGKANLQPRPPTEAGYDREMLYSEEGDFKTDNGMVFRANRKYVYRYRSQRSQMTAWFVKPQDDGVVDYLFHQVKAKNRAHGTSDSCKVEAQGYHLCVKDDYNANYTFNIDRDQLITWRLAYNVKGPNKDYVSSTSFSRISGPDASSLDHGNAAVEPAFSAGNQSTQDEHFKAYCWLGQRKFLATSSQGRILIGSLQHDGTSESAHTQDDSEFVHWSTTHQLDDLRSYSVCTNVGPGRALLGGASGHMYLYEEASNQIDSVLKLDRKIAGIFVAGYEGSDRSLRIVATCTGQPFASYFSMPDTHTPITSRSALELPPNFVVTCAWTLSNDCIVLGSRAGALCLFDLSKAASLESVKLEFFKPHVHGQDAVTTIREVPSQNAHLKGVYFLTTGRDGTYGVHRLTSELRLWTVHRSRPPLGPNVEGACFQAKTVNLSQDEEKSLEHSRRHDRYELLLWGFRGKSFAVWSHHQQTEILAADCGGPHRSWAYLPGDEPGMVGGLVWTQASACHVHVQTAASHRIIQRGGHGRDIKAIAARPSIASATLPVLIATGAEDTTIQISKITPLGDKTRGLDTVCVASEHTTGVHALRWSRDSSFLFSAGGREELMVWRVQEVPCLEIGIACVARAPRVTASGELRVMDLDLLEQDGEAQLAGFRLIVAVYSDASLRVRIQLLPPRYLHADWINSYGLSNTLMTSAISFYLLVGRTAPLASLNASSSLLKSRRVL